MRLQRLGYFTEVNVETPAVPDTADQVDVHYTVVEQAGGKLMAGVGFSQSAGIIFQTSVTQDNFLGSGKRVGFDFNNSDINRRYGLSYLDPYWTVDGVSLGYSAYYRETNAGNANLSNYDSTVAGGAIIFGIPLTEYNSLRSTFSVENTELDCSTGSVNTQCLKFVIEVGDNIYNVLKWNNRIAYDTRNKAIFPDKGMLHSINADITFPSFGNSLEFYKIEYETAWYTNLLEEYVFLLHANLGYGNGYSDTDELPFFENFYAGGPRSVRGYEENTLGPKDTTGNSIGGNIKLTGGAEVILPVPFLRDLKSVRIAGFLEAGNVYDNTLDLGQLRYSVGLSGMWVSPFGIISVSVAQPFNDKPGDMTQAFQFTFGSSF